MYLCNIKKMKVSRFTFNMFGVNTYILWDDISREALIVDPGMINEKEQKEIQAAINKANQEAAAGQGDSNKNTITGTGNFAWPVPGYYTISSQFGRRWGRNHNGIDIASSNGTVYGAKIVAADSGTVILSKYYSGYGYCVIVNHGNGYTTLYAHMKAQSALRVGDSVTKGSTIIGYVGASGNVTGPHLHFEIKYKGKLKGINIIRPKNSILDLTSKDDLDEMLDKIMKECGPNDFLY